MYLENNPLTVIDKTELTEKTLAMKNDGYRLVQICCTAGGQYELTYTFEKDSTLSSLRVLLSPSDLVIQSISGHYLAAFTYENEMQDLFGLTVEGLKINYSGKFYRIAQKTPFAKKPQQSA